jgi:hypothetical protein
MEKPHHTESGKPAIMSGSYVPFDDDQPVLLRLVLDLYNWLVPLAAINIIWLFMSVTIILLPPATAALFHVAHLVIRGEGPTVGNFLAGIRKWWLKSWLWGLTLAAYVVISFFALTFYSAMTSPVGIVLFAISAVVILVIGLTQFYFWPYLMLQEQPSILLALRNSALTVLGAPLLVLLNVVIALVLLAVGLALLVPFAFFVPVTIAFLSTYTLVNWLKRRDMLPEM